ncbi:MAG: YndJ family protein [Actinomycetota bacterium]|nr:YndJ family protein [Actinomycetota bacterium]
MKGEKPGLWRHEAVGAALWLAVAAGWASGAASLSVIDVLLALALLVVTPAALPMLDGSGRVWWGRGWLAAVVMPAAACGAVSVALSPGTVGGVLALPWFGVCSFVAVHGPRRWLRERSLSLVHLTRFTSALFLMVGGAWLVASGFAWRPLGFRSDIVELTAVHFHYAGMASSLLASVTLSAVEHNRGPLLKAARVAAVAIGFSPPLIAAGFIFSPVLQVAGGVSLATGLIILAVITIRSVLPALPAGPWRPLLTVSAVAVAAPMVLAVDWVVGQHSAIPALTIPQMAATHGAINAVGFVLCGVLGWRLLQETQDTFKEDVRSEGGAE